MFNCLCGHIGKVAVKDQMLKYGGDTTVDAVEKPHVAVVAGAKILLALRSFMWAVVSLQCTVRTRPRTTKTSSSIEKVGVGCEVSFLEACCFAAPSILMDWAVLRYSRCRSSGLASHI